MATRVPKEERETIIRFDETDDPAVIYTSNAELKRRIKTFAKKNPELCRKRSEDKSSGNITYELEKTRLSIRFTEPYSEARLKSVGDLGRKNGRKNSD